MVGDHGESEERERRGMEETKDKINSLSSLIRESSTLEIGDHGRLVDKKRSCFVRALMVNNVRHCPYEPYTSPPGLLDQPTDPSR